MYIYHTYAFCSTLFQTSVDQITPINDQNSINNNLSADRKYISISEQAITLRKIFTRQNVW